ncbi:MAG: helix-turn-helix domain-containing protein [Candidatus Aquicultor sp.]
MNTEPIGQVLSEARIKLGKSIKEVEFDTKIRAKYVEALEQDYFDYLPGNIYTQGFIKTYATYLGIDPEPLVQQYKSLHEQKSTDDLGHVSANMRLRVKKRPPWMIAAVVVGAIGVLFISLIAWGAWVQHAANDPKVVVQDVKTRKPVDTVVAAATTSTTAKKSRGNDKTVSSGSNSSSSTTDTELKTNIVVKLTGINSEGSWAKVTVDGEKKYEGVINDGVTKQFKGGESIRVRIGNISGLEVMVNGKRQSKNKLKTTNGIFDKTYKAGSKPAD